MLLRPLSPKTLLQPTNSLFLGKEGRNSSNSARMRYSQHVLAQHAVLLKPLLDFPAQQSYYDHYEQRKSYEELEARHGGGDRT